jgi:hypothetical protein
MSEMFSESRVTRGIFELFEDGGCEVAPVFVDNIGEGRSEGDSIKPVTEAVVGGDGGEADGASTGIAYYTYMRQVRATRC